MKYSHPTLIKKLLQLVKPLSHIMLITVIMGTLGFMAASFIAPLGMLGITKILGFSYLPHISLTTIVILLIVLSVLRGILRYLEQLSGHYIAFKLLALIRDKVFTAVKRLAFEKLHTKNAGDLLAIITADIELLEVFFAHTIAPVCIAFLSSVIFIICFAVISPILALVATLSYLAVAIGLPIIFSRRKKHSGEDFRKEISELNTYFLDSLRGMKEIIFFDAQERREKGLTDRSHAADALSKKIKMDNSFDRTLTDLVLFLCNTAMVVTSSILYTQGTLSFPGMAVAIILLLSSFGPVTAVSALPSNLVQTFASANRVISLLEEEAKINPVHGKTDISFNELSVKNVNFAYNTEQILHNISFNAQKNQTIGIHGKSGSGKSTLLKLIMRFYDPDSGQIDMNTVNLPEINTASLQNAVSYVTQKTDIFNKTMYENLRLAKLDATQEEIIEAAKKANLHDFIMTLPNAYETKMSEMGSNLSDGEKQRLGLARAFLHAGSLILLDEPTSNLDSLNEAMILKALADEKENKCIILVSHRKSTMGIADTVISIDSGRIS